LRQASAATLENPERETDMCIDCRHVVALFLVDAGTAFEKTLGNQQLYALA